MARFILRVALSLSERDFAVFPAKQDIAHELHGTVDLRVCSLCINAMPSWQL